MRFYKNNESNMIKAIQNRTSVMALAMVAAFVSLFAAGSASASVSYSSQLATTTDLFQQVGGDLMSSAVVVIGIVFGIAVFIFVAFWGWNKLKRKGMK